MRLLSFIAPALLMPPLWIGAQARPAALDVLAIERLEMPASKAVVVSSSSIKPGAEIPLVHSDYDQKVSPALRWSGVPSGARSIAILMEDSDALEPKPFVHWLLYNLPPTLDSLPEALPGTPRLADLDGALQGRTSRGNIGYFGPRPPAADPPHHYHFQVFALDSMLSLDPGVSREALLAAMRGHVLAAGTLVGTFRAPPTSQ